jgi:hypothetical protein
MRILVAAMIGVLVLSGVAAAQEFRGPPWFSAERCSQEDAIAADKDIDQLKSWSALHRAFRLYRQCDDGGIAEGYSDAVAILLTEHWPEVTALSKLVQTNPEFERFVLLHVDSLMSPEQGKMIIDNARDRCPAGAEKLCRQLEAKAKNPF